MKTMRQILACLLCAALLLGVMPAALATEVPVQKVNVSPSSLTLTVNGSETLSATVEPATTTQTGVIFSSSDTSIATVDAYGRVTGRKAGSCVVYATSASDSTRWASCTVRVLQTTSITLSSSNVSLQTGFTHTLFANVEPEEMIGQGVSFRSSNPYVAVVSNTGNTSTVITGVGQGTATIYASAADGTMATCQVTVGVPVTAVKLSKTTITINTGSQTSLTATVEPSNATNRAVSWSSSNTNVATVDAYGNITTWEAGYATIKCTSQDSGISASCGISVVGVSVTHVPTPTPSPTPAPTLAPGATYTPPPMGVTAYVNTATGSLNLRATASSGGKILTTIPEKGSFTLLEKGTKWCKVWYKGITGYVMTAYVRFDKPLPTVRPGVVTATPTLQPGSPSGTVAYVNTVYGSLNMRSAATSGSKIVKRIPEKAAITVITPGADWSYVWYNGSSGYVMTKFIRMANATATPIGTTATPKPATVATPTPQPLSGSRAQVSSSNGGSVNMRAAESATSARVRLVPNGEIVDVLKYGKEWCQVSYKGSTGYMMTKFLYLGTGVNKTGTPATKAPAATTPVSTGGTKYAQVNTITGGLNLRKGPGNGYTRITVIPKNAYVTVLADGPVWTQVNYNGNSGYVMTVFLKKL